MKYYLKQIGFCLLYLFFMDSIAFGIDSLGSEFIEYALYIANIGLFFFLMWVVCKKEGEEARKVLETNDAERRRILETGKIVPLKRAQEYRPYKGFLLGIIICAPMIILLLIHLLIHLFGGESNIAGIIAANAYVCFWMPYSALVAGGTTIVAWGQYFVLLYAVPIISIMLGVPYLLGADKIQKQYDAFKKHHKEIHGE